MERGRAVITDRGRPAHVLLTFDAYEALIGSGHVLDLLAQPDGVADIEFVAPRGVDPARPAIFD